ncbi:MAG TPA: CoA transferase [Acidimicrobiales bacterium]|nr:CoA transferase [Acidimicrobiales bacterium]
MTDGADPVAAWAASGAMWLTGHPDGPPLSPAAAVVPALQATARELPVEVDVAELLAGRAALLGLGRRGRTSANGSCRLLPTTDGWVAVNLARPSDAESVGALVEAVVDDDPWAVLTRAAARMTGADLVDRGTLLGIPVAELPGPGRVAPAAAFTLHRLGEAGTTPDVDGELVVDLSAMWAGPLCAHLLGRTGMRVVKVESTRRPDGARAGHPGFYEWLHAGHASVTLDLATAAGRTALAELVDRADVVVESSRPRALAQLGIRAEAVVASRPGRTWVSITGYGRTGEAAHRVAFGDDAAAAAGLVARDDEGLPVFCADAVADPISGLSAAVGALASVAEGGGHLVEVAMVDAVRATLATPVEPAAAHRTPDGDWVVKTPTGEHPVAPPRPPAC